MSEVKTLDSGAFAPVISARTGQGNVIRLAIAQALAGANSTVIYATGAILGNTLLIAAAAGAGLAGTATAHFWLSMLLLGVGRNFGFLGASALVLERHRPEGRTGGASLDKRFFPVQWSCSGAGTDWIATYCATGRRTASQASA